LKGNEMGLDMMLYRRREDGEIGEEVMYWRKANAIHLWFVENVQDGIDECEPHDVSVHQLEILRENCARIIADSELAEDVLPTGSGFFFGSTDYDEYYYDEITRTVEELDKILEQVDSDEQFIYCSSW
jgi:hypothetical protein